jgi:hypothetical protein
MEIGDLKFSFPTSLFLPLSSGNFQTYAENNRNINYPLFYVQVAITNLERIVKRIASQAGF